MCAVHCLQHLPAVPPTAERLMLLHLLSMHPAPLEVSYHSAMPTTMNTSNRNVIDFTVGGGDLHNAKWHKSISKDR